MGHVTSVPGVGGEKRRRMMILVLELIVCGWVPKPTLRLFSAQVLYEGCGVSRQPVPVVSAFHQSPPRCLSGYVFIVAFQLTPLFPPEA